MMMMMSDDSNSTNKRNISKGRSTTKLVVLLFLLCILGIASFMASAQILHLNELVTTTTTGIAITTTAESSNPFINPPQVVILPGPHKTGSTSIQGCMVKWTLHDVRNKHPLGNWTWAIPSPDSLDNINLYPLNELKRFAGLLAILRNNTKFNKRKEDKRNPLPVDKQEVIQAYRDAIGKAWWDEGKNIVLGAEAMDYMTNPYITGKGGVPINGSEILEGILDILPWDYHLYSNHSSSDDKVQRERLDMKRDVEVVVSYRAPRVDHLISIWHEDGRVNQTISQFFLSKLGKEDFAWSNTFPLALKFLERGIPTTIIDTSGVWDTNYHHYQHEPFGLCQVVVCEIFRLECNEHHQIPNTRDQSNKRVNVKMGRGEMDLSNEQLANIDSIMNRFDCSLQSTLLEYLVVDNGSSLSSKKLLQQQNQQEQQLLRILYPNEIFRHCYPELDNYNGVHFTWMVDEIQKIISNST